MADKPMFTEEELAEFAPGLLPGNPAVSEGIDPELDSVLALLPGMGVLPSSMRRGATAGAGALLKGGLDSVGSVAAKASPAARKAAKAKALKELEDASRALKVAGKNPTLTEAGLDAVGQLDELEELATTLRAATKNPTFGTMPATAAEAAFGSTAKTASKGTKTVDGFRPYSVAGKAAAKGGKVPSKTVVAGSAEGAFNAASKAGLKGATGAMPKSRADLAAWVAGMFNRVPGGPIAKVANLAGFAGIAIGIEQLLEGAFDYRLNPKDVERAELQKEQFLKAVGQISEEEAILQGGGATVNAIVGRMDRALEGVERRDRLDMTRLMSENGEALRSVAQPQRMPLAELYMRLMGGQQ